MKRAIAEGSSDVITQTNSNKQEVENLTLFQAHKQVFLKQLFNRQFSFYFPPISFRTLSRGFNNLHSPFRLRALRYSSRFLTPLTTESNPPLID